MAPPSPQEIEVQVRNALAEDVGSGDLSAALVPENALCRAEVICRKAGVICGQAWVDEVFRQVGPEQETRWHVAEGAEVQAGDVLLEVSGPARGLLSGERTALNFLQLLSGTATRSHRYAKIVEGTGVRLLDTRKTLPGLRAAQKYAVSCGGCFNHRLGLFDAILIKENHIRACGSIAAAVATAQEQAPGKPVEVEVENLDELEQALAAGAERIMLDNFSLEDAREAVTRTGGRAELEASGGIADEATLLAFAQTGVDFISLGTLTKDPTALDLSMQIVEMRHKGDD